MRRLVSTAVLIVAFAGAAHAEATATFREGARAMFSFDVPDFWTLRAGGTQVLSPPGADEARAVPQLLSMRPTVEPKVWMGFYSPPGVASVEEGRAYLREIGHFLTGSPTVTEVEGRNIGGRRAEVFHGTGKRRGRSIRFAVAVIDLPGPRVAIVASVVEAGAGPGEIATINDVYGSFRAN